MKRKTVEDLVEENNRLREENNRWLVQNEELRKIIIGHESKTRLDVKQKERLKLCTKEIVEVIHLLRRNDMNAWADGIEARLDAME